MTVAAVERKVHRPEFSAVHEYPANDDPYLVADQLSDDGHMAGWIQRDGGFWQWNGCAYERRSKQQLRAYLGGVLKQKWFSTSEGKPKPWAPTTSRLNNVIDALNLGDVPDPDRVLLALSNGWFDPASGELLPPTPTRFVSSCSEFSYDPEAGCPEWLAFLSSLWPDDPGAIALLQEWMGYLVSGSMEKQKALLMEGPTRAGKGVILFVAETLMGTESTGALKASNLTGWFGLQTLVGKRLAVAADMRLDGRLSAAAIECLLSLIAGDLQNIQQKGAGNEPLDVRLAARLMVATNGAPSFNDPGDALRGRFLYLKLTRSFLGAEDEELAARLAGEMSGILNWALVGLRRLTETGAWTKPDSSQVLMDEVDEYSSPVGRYLADCCAFAKPGEPIREDLAVPVAALYADWTSWAKKRGHRTGTDADFGKEMKARLGDRVQKRRQGSGSRSMLYVGVAIKA